MATLVLPCLLLLVTLLAGVPSINVAHLILCSFLFHFAFAAAPFRAWSAKGRKGQLRSGYVSLFTPPLLLPTNSLGKQESLDWIAVKKRGGHKGYGVARFVSFCEPDLISWNLNRLSNSNSISIIYLMRGSKGAEREGNEEREQEGGRDIYIDIKCVFIGT